MNSNDRDISTNKLKENDKRENFILNEENKNLLKDKYIVSDSVERRKKEKKSNKNYSKKFKCDKCDKRYTWYSGLSNHKRFVHNKQKETMSEI